MKIFLVKSDLFKFLLKSRCWEPLRVSTLKEFSRNYSFLQHKKKKKKKQIKKDYTRGEQTTITISWSVARISSRQSISPSLRSNRSDRSSPINDAKRRDESSARRTRDNRHYFNRRTDEIIDSSTLHHIVETCVNFRVGYKGQCKESWPHGDTHKVVNT